MSDYVKATNFYSKDALLTGNPDKIIKGAEIDDEFNAIATAIATKANLNSPNFTGTPTVPTAPSGTNTTQSASTAFVKAAIDTNSAAVNITGGTIDNVAITDGTISSLDTPLEVASGGSGAATLAANAVLLGNGTSALQTVAPSTSGNLLTSDGTTWKSVAPIGGIGTGQTWQNVVSSRSSGTSYTNNTGKPIMVCVSSGFAGYSSLSAVVDSVTVLDRYVQFEPSKVGGEFIVPNGSTYSVTSSSGFSAWAELR